MTTGYVYPGRVVDIDPAGPIVTVPLLAQNARWGPLPTTVADLIVGEQVIVTSLGTSRDQLVIIGRLPGRTPDVTEIPGLEDRLDTLDDTDAAASARMTAIEGVNTTQNGRLTTVEGRATTVEGRATTLESRATAIEGVNTTQNTRMTTIEGVNTTQDTAITNAANAGAAASTAVTTLRADTAGKVTTKGDILVGTAAGVLARQAAGANGAALLADSTQTNGVIYTDIRGLPVASTGLPGATSASRFAGSTVTGKPTTGTFAAGDFVIDRTTGDVWVCSVAGTPGTWVSRALAASQGIVARARRQAHYGPLINSEQVRFTVTGMALLANRLYRIRVHSAGGFYSPVGVGFGLMRLRYTTNNTTPTTASAQITQSIIYIGNNQQSFTIDAEAYYAPPADQTVGVAMTTQCGQTDYWIYAAADYPTDFTVEDCGPAAGFAGL